MSTKTGTIPNYDATTGIHYGVISQHSICPESFDDIWTQARDLTYESAVEDAKREIAAVKSDKELSEWMEEHLVGGPSRPLWAEAILLDYTTNDGMIVNPDAEVWEHIWSEIEEEFNDAYNMNDCCDRSWLYERNGYALRDCLDSDVFVILSPYFTYAPRCSPCVPNAGNLDSASKEHLGDASNYGFKSYCLGHDFFESNQAPYPVYSVETGELVNP